MHAKLIISSYFCNSFHPTLANEIIWHQANTKPTNRFNHSCRAWNDSCEKTSGKKSSPHRKASLNYAWVPETEDTKTMVHLKGTFDNHISRDMPKCVYFGNHGISTSYFELCIYMDMHVQRSPLILEILQWCENCCGIHMLPNALQNAVIFGSIYTQIIWGIISFLSLHQLSHMNLIFLFITP